MKDISDTGISRAKVASICVSKFSNDKFLAKTAYRCLTSCFEI